MSSYIPPHKRNNKSNDIKIKKNKNDFPNLIHNKQNNATISTMNFAGITSNQVKTPETPPPELPEGWVKLSNYAKCNKNYLDENDMDENVMYQNIFTQEELDEIDDTHSYDKWFSLGQCEYLFYNDAYSKITYTNEPEYEIEEQSDYETDSNSSDEEDLDECDLLNHNKFFSI